MLKSLAYKGYEIKLESNEQDDGKTIAGYKLINSKSGTSLSTGIYLDGKFNSEQEGLTAAENAARAWIDKNPIGM